MVLQPMTSQLCLVAINFLSADVPSVPPRANARGGTLDLLMTDVPELVGVAVVAPIGSSDHSSLSAVFSMAQAVPNLFVKHP